VYILQALIQQFLNFNHHNGNAMEIVKMEHIHVAIIYKPPIINALLTIIYGLTFA
jgi:hypothetical protein